MKDWLLTLAERERMRPVKKFCLLSFIGSALHIGALAYLVLGALGLLSESWPNGIIVLVGAAILSLCGLLLQLKISGDWDVVTDWMNFLSSGIQVYSVLYFVGGIFGSFSCTPASLTLAAILFLLSIFLSWFMGHLELKRAIEAGKRREVERMRKNDFLNSPKGL